MGGRAVNGDRSAALGGGENVGVEAGAVGNVRDGDALIGEYVGGGHEIFVYADGTRVVQVAFRHSGAVDLSFQ